MEEKKTGIEFTEGELELITNAEGQLALKISGLNTKDEKEVQQRLAEIEQERDRIIADTTRGALARHIEAEHNPGKVFEKAKATIKLMFSFGAQDLDEALEKDPTGKAAEALVKKALVSQYDELQGATTSEGELMTQHLDLMIIEKIKEKQGDPIDIRGVLELIEQSKEARHITSVRMGSDAVTKAVFDNAIKHEDQPIVISGVGDPATVYASIVGQKLRPGDRLIAATMSGLDEAGYYFIDLQTLHNYMTNNGNYKRLPDTDREYYKQRIEAMRKSDLKLDITEALDKFTDLEDLPTETKQGGAKWGHKDRTASIVDFLLPVVYVSFNDIEGYYFRGRSWIAQFSQKIKQQSIVGLNLMKLTGKTTLMRYDIFVYLDDRIRQARGPKIMKNSGVITCKAIYDKLGIPKSERRKRQTARETTEKWLDHFKQEGAIYGYQKVTRGRVIHSYNLLLEEPTEAIEDQIKMTEG